MASRRMIDPNFWQSESVAQLPIAVRYFFIGLFSNADDQGRMKAHPALLRSKLYPYDDIELTDIERMLEWLCNDFILVYEVDGRDYLQILNWWKYQRPRWAWPSDHPAPEGWNDRVHYRQGNAVMKHNWDNPDANAVPLSDDDDSHGEPTVEPEWNQNGATVEPAPSGSNSTSISGRTSGSDSDSKDSFAATAPASADNGGGSADYAEMRKAWGELFPKKPQPRANNKTLQAKVRTRMRSEHFRENWYPAMKRAAQSQFCRDGPWFDFSWFVRNDDHYERCLTGRYDDSSTPKRSSDKDGLTAADIIRGYEDYVVT